MTKLEILNDAVHIDASIVAQGLGFEPSFVQTMIRKGEITSLCERGVDEDAGRHRLTFFHKNRRFRLRRSATTRNRAQAWRVSGGTGAIGSRSYRNRGDEVDGTEGKEAPAICRERTAKLAAGLSGSLGINRPPVPSPNRVESRSRVSLKRHRHPGGSFPSPPSGKA
jgi:hypothetical protein